jgi:indolepyruvate ferredoxin oxidoreductase
VTKTVVTLDYRYEQRSGQIFLSSMQALVRLPLDQKRRDMAAGLVYQSFPSSARSLGAARSTCAAACRLWCRNRWW